MTGLFARTLDLNDIKKQAPAVFTQQPKNTVSNEHYLFIPTERIITGLLNNGFKVVSASQQGARTEDQKGYAKHILHLIHESQDQDLKCGGEYPLLRVQNSHDAKSSFQLSTGIFRLVCSNGLVCPETEFNSARIVHNLSTDSASIDAAFKVIANHEKELEMIDQMKAIQLTRDERMLLAESSRNILFDEDVIKLNNDNNQDLRPKLLKTRRPADNSVDLWTTFNVIQENAIKGGFRVLRPTERGKYQSAGNRETRMSYARTREVKGIDADKKINVELMALAQKFAALKAA